MSLWQGFTTATVSKILAEEITARSGVVVDSIQDGTRFFARSVLPDVEEVRPGDRLQGGVALRATESEVWLHPYVFRTVCSNGAIMAHALQTRHLTELDLQDSWEAEAALREAIQVCCEEETFRTSACEFRSATEREADLALNLLSVFSRISSHHAPELQRVIMDQFFAGSDRSSFGLTNAVTAVARDTRDPELRWSLEELGGAIAAGITQPSCHPGDNQRPRRSLAVA